MAGVEVLEPRACVREDEYGEQADETDLDGCEGVERCGPGTG